MSSSWGSSVLMSQFIFLSWRLRLSVWKATWMFKVAKAIKRKKLKSHHQVMRPDFWVSHILAPNADAKRDFRMDFNNGSIVGVSDTFPWWLRGQHLFGCVRSGILKNQSANVLSYLILPIWLTQEVERITITTFRFIPYHAVLFFLGLAQQIVPDPNKSYATWGSSTAIFSECNGLDSTF